MKAFSEISSAVYVATNQILVIDAKVEGEVKVRFEGRSLVEATTNSAQSVLSARAGSVEAALRAGISPASTAMKAMIAIPIA
jgi:hypothetical protein